jgi:hypothetical protein
MITNKGRLDTLLNLSSNDDSFTPMGLGFGVITDTKMEGEVFISIGCLSKTFKGSLQRPDDSRPLLASSGY